MEKENFIFRRAKVDDILSVMKVIENRCLWMKENGINQWDEEYLKLYDFNYFALFHLKYPFIKISISPSITAFIFPDSADVL